MDEYANFAGGLDSPAKDGFQITPDDGVDLPKATRALHVGIGGAVHLTLVSGAQVTLTGVNTGAMLPVRAMRVHATGTTAGELVGLL